MDKQEKHNLDNLQRVSEDPRKTGLKKGLRQLTKKQLENLLAYGGPMILDDCNYKNGMFCPLAIGVGLDKMRNPTNEKVIKALESKGYSVYNTRGIKGDFYTNNRRKDLLVALMEVLQEKLNGI